MSESTLDLFERAYAENWTELDLAGWGTIEIPPQIAKLKNLKKLDISGNVVAKISPEIKKLHQLQEILAHKCYNFEPPDIIYELPQLRKLDLSDNEWSNLSPKISNLENLTHLDLSGNELTNLPSEITKLTNIEFLDLSENRFTIFPKEICALTSLKLLDVSDNRISAIPTEISHLANLIELYFESNNLNNLPKHIGKLQNLRIFNISFNNITSLPTEFGQLENLVELELKDNRLVVLPPEISSLINLKILNIGENKVSNLPLQFNQLVNLGSLEIDDNPLGEIPQQIFQLTNLLILSAEECNISKIPEEIKLLKNLKFLNLSNTTNLEKKTRFEGGIEVPYYRNKISEMPPQIGELDDLENLTLLGNKLKELPSEILNLKKLKFLMLGENLLDIPPEILDKVDDPQSIINYYFSLKEQKKQPIYEIKLLIVGQGSVGKTSLVRQILHGTFDQNQTKTEGISINQWQVEVGKKRKSKSKSKIENKKSDVKLNIWDFGGQEIMHATHQFFLTKRSLYLLVLDARLTQEENRVEYWLKIIQSFGGESPVLIVGNKTDQHPLDIDRTGLVKKYPNIVGILETSAATGAGIEALKAEIAKQVDTLPHVRDLLPETWFTVKSKLEQLGRDQNFITQDEYLDLCGANDVTDETSQHTLIGFLHDLGVVLHFQDDPRLEALGILNPQWVTNGVYKILNSHELFQNKGKLTLPLLNQILSSPEYPTSKHLFIVDMMKKFELCYDIEHDKSFLIPDLLPKDEPFTGEWDDVLAFQYHYNVLPSSIISRFIVRMNAFLHKTVWRSGIVLKNGGNTALVKADTEERKIYIWVAGDKNTRRDFLSAIRMDFNAIHKTIAKIESSEKVPLPNYPKADPVDYTLLLQLEQKGIKTHHVQAGNDLVEITVAELLDGVRPSKDQAAKVFINYSHTDKTFVKKLASELENTGMKVWWDFDALKGGDDWQKEIERGIKQCEYFLVALTPDAVDSEWVTNEIAYALQAQKTIIPLHKKKCDIPIGLIKKQYIDFEKQTQKSATEELIGILKSQQPA